MISIFTDANVGNFTAIRTIRVLKVLKTIQRVEGVRKLVSSLLNSAPLLLNVGNLLMFIFFIFGIFGNQLFMGTFRQRCFFEEVRANYLASTSNEAMAMAKAKAEDSAKAKRKRKQR